MGKIKTRKTASCFARFCGGGTKDSSDDPAVKDRSAPVVGEDSSDSDSSDDDGAVAPLPSSERDVARSSEPNSTSWIVPIFIGLFLGVALGAAGLYFFLFY